MLHFQKLARTGSSNASNAFYLLNSGHARHVPPYVWTLRGRRIIIRLTERGSAELHESLGKKCSVYEAEAGARRRPLRSQQHAVNNSARATGRLDCRPGP